MTAMVLIKMRGNNFYLEGKNCEPSELRRLSILKGKRNAYFDFQNVGFILRTNFVLIPAIYTHRYRQLNSETNFFNAFI